MNTRTLGCLQQVDATSRTEIFCTTRIGKADIDVASRAVDVNSRARQLCYPRGNFSVIPGPHQEGHRGSLGQTFVPEFSSIVNSVRLAFALTLYVGFLTRLSQPLGPTDIFLAGCHPSRTVRQLVS